MNDPKEKIYSDLIEYFGTNNPKKFSIDDIQFAFELYDEGVFHHQIKDKIASEHSQLKFYISSKRSGVSGLCGKKYSPAECIYYIQISMGTFKKVHGDDRVQQLQYILERCIIHLLMIVWGYWDESQENLRMHGPLFYCMLKKYFPYQRRDDVKYKENITIISRSIYPYDLKSDVKIGGLKYWENSCYIDSLIMILLAGASNFYRTNIFSIDPDDIYYESTSFCLKARNEEDMKVIAKKIRDDLAEIYRSVIDGETVKCTRLRKYMADCIPDLRDEGGYIQYTVSDIYDFITDVYPALKISGYPEKIVRSKSDFGDSTSERYTLTPTSAFSMWDYMEPSDAIGSHIIWEKYRFPIIVFRNGFNPPIKKFSQTGKEKIDGLTVTKERAFHEYLNISDSREREISSAIGGTNIFRKEKLCEIDAKSLRDLNMDVTYRLFAVIINNGLGTTLERSYGGHYTSYIRPFFDKDNWYYYDDMNPKLVRKPRLDISVFNGTTHRRPELFFYQRMKV
jgi:hypothetical protein